MDIESLARAAVAFQDMREQGLMQRRHEPSGLKYLNHGISRSAFLHEESGKVFKVGDSYTNRSEVNTAKNLRKQNLLWVSIPNVELVDFGQYRASVVVMDYIDGDFTSCDSMYYNGVCSCNRGSECFAIMHNRIYEETQVFDIHDENVLIDKDGVLWLIDMG